MALRQLSNRCYESAIPIGFRLCPEPESKEWKGENMTLDIRKVLMPLDENLYPKPYASAADRITEAINEVGLLAPPKN